MLPCKSSGSLGKAPVDHTSYGNLRYKLKTPNLAGAPRVTFEPLDFIGRLAASVLKSLVADSLNSPPRAVRLARDAHKQAQTETETVVAMSETKHEADQIHYGLGVMLLARVPSFCGPRQ